MRNTDNTAVFDTSTGRLRVITRGDAARFEITIDGATVGGALAPDLAQTIINLIDEVNTGTDRKRGKDGYDSLHTMHDMRNLRGAQVGDRRLKLIYDNGSGGIEPRYVIRVHTSDRVQLIEREVLISQATGATKKMLEALLTLLNLHRSMTDRIKRERSKRAAAMVEQIRQVETGAWQAAVAAGQTTVSLERWLYDRAGELV